MNCCKKCTIRESGRFLKKTIPSNFIVINVSFSYRMNIQILGAMIKQGCVQHNFEYVLKIMNIVRTERIKPNENFLKHLQNFHENCLNFKKTDVCANIQ